MRVGGMGMGAGLRYLWFYLLMSPQRAQRFEGSTILFLGSVGTGCASGAADVRGQPTRYLSEKGFSGER